MFSFQNHILVLFVSASMTLKAYACPPVGRFVDISCDAQFKIVFVGDSIVAGKGDTVNGGYGGYPLRIHRRFPEVDAVNFGISGISSNRLLAHLKSKLSRGDPNATARKFLDADMIVIDVGRNDWWNEPVLGGYSPGLVVRNIARIVDFLRGYYLAHRGSAPLFAVATLLPVNSSDQGPYVEEINRLLRLYRHSERLPVYLNFDKMDPHRLGGDGLHPVSKGYTALARIAAAFLTGKAQLLSQCMETNCALHPAQVNCGCGR
jgi:lysophospholipase L1-like esterase